MNKTDLKNLQKLVDELRKLSTNAFRRAQTIIEEGQLVPEEHRAMSEGYAGGYDYCISRLKTMFMELK